MCIRDSYERALRTASACLAHQNLRAYLHSILRNLFIDQCRRASRRPRPLSLDSAELGGAALASEGAEPASPAWLDITAEQVTAALAQLPAEFRVVFELHAFEHLRYSEIAKRLGIAPATVGTRLLRARGRLRALLSRPGG